MISLSKIIIFLVKIACYVESTCTNSANTKDVNIGITYTKDIYIENASTCIGSAYIKV